MTEQTNRHPVDELSDVRLEIRQLKLRESELRVELLADGAGRIGEEYEALVSDSTRQTFDVRAAIEALGMDVLRPFYRKTTCHVLKLKRRVTRRTVRR